MAHIAVVIPCYNSGRFVTDAVDSVCAQSRPASEIIVVDDGSTDIYTQQVIASLARPRLRVEQISHVGAARASNHGVAMTSSEHLLFLDSDDMLDPAYLERAGACLEEEPDLDFVSTAMRGFGESSYVWMPPPAEVMAALTRGTIPITALMRRTVWDAVGGFDESLPASMDLDFWITAFEAGYRGKVLGEPLLLRRVRADSLHHSTVAKRRFGTILATILRKHRATVERLGPELFIAKQAYVTEQRGHRDILEERCAELHVQLQQLNHEIHLAQERLRDQGESMTDVSAVSPVEPISPVWGLDRGRPVDRYYIDRFVEAHRQDIRGRVLEVKDSGYTEKYGTVAVTASEVIDIAADNPLATIVADLTRADDVPSESFDCFILTQTLHIIYDVQAALRHAHRMLKPGGVLLATFPAVSRLNDQDGGRDQGDHWRFTEAGLRRLFGEVFGPGNADLAVRGNLKACMAFLYGLAAEELLDAELDRVDPDCPLTYCVRAVKPAGRGQPISRRRSEDGEHPHAGILMYHRIADMASDPHQLCVGPEVFRSQMRYLAERHLVLSLADLASAVAAGDVPPNAVAITFDDGTLDALHAASPVLVEYGLPATFFVNTENLDHEHEPWWDVLGRVLLGDTTLPPTFDIALDGEDRRFPLRDSHERAEAYSAIHHSLIPARLSDRARIMAEVTRASVGTLEARDTRRLLLGEELKRLADRPGHSVGSHSVHHLFLTRQELAQRTHEIQASKIDLERILQRPVTLFSYPYGAHDGDTIEIVRKAGYFASVTTVPAAVSAATDRYALPRLDVKGWSPSEFSGALRQLLSQPPSERC